LDGRRGGVRLGRAQISRCFQPRCNGSLEACRPRSYRPRLMRAEGFDWLLAGGAAHQVVDTSCASPVAVTMAVAVIGPGGLGVSGGTHRLPATVTATATATVTGPRRGGAVTKRAAEGTSLPIKSSTPVVSLPWPLPWPWP
jgi:hypothetical protein